jgi:hypothetical protein
MLVTSSCDSETYAAAAAAKEAMHLRRLLTGSSWYSITTYRAAGGQQTHDVTAAKNGTDKDKSKHIDVSAHFLRGKCREGSICFFYVPGTENIGSLQQKPKCPSLREIQGRNGSMLSFQNTSLFSLCSSVSVW